MILTLPLPLLGIFLSRYPVISLFTPKDGLSLSKVAIHFKLFPHVLLKGICCCCFSINSIPLRKFSLMTEGRLVYVILA